MCVTLSPEQIREYRGTLTEPGKEQPVQRQKRLKKILDLFERMKNGEFEDGTRKCFVQRLIWLHLISI